MCMYVQIIMVLPVNKVRVLGQDDFYILGTEWGPTHSIGDARGGSATQWPRKKNQDSGNILIRIQQA